MTDITHDNPLPTTDPQVLEVLSEAEGPRSWTQPAPITTTAGVATPVLAAGYAKKRLVIINESNFESVRLRWDGGDANSMRGLLLPPQNALVLGAGEVPSERISAYSTTPVVLNISYC